MKMTLPEPLKDPSNFQRELARKAKGLFAACELLRFTFNEATFEVMLKSLADFTADEVEAATAEIARLNPRTAGSPSAEIADRIKIARRNEAAMKSGKPLPKTEAKDRAPRDLVRGIVAGVEQRSQAEIDRTRARDEVLEAEEKREVAENIRRLRAQNQEKAKTRASSAASPTRRSRPRKTNPGPAADQGPEAALA